MDQETAQAVLFGLLTVGIGVWLAGLRAVVGAFRVKKPAEDQETLADLPPTPNRLTGSTEVQGQPSILAAKAASLLVRGTLLGPIRIVEKTDDHVTFERVGPVSVTYERPAPVTSPAARWVLRGDLRFVAAGQGRSRVEWTVELTDRGHLLKVAVMFLILGVLALGIGAWAIETYLVPSPVPAIRTQSIQMVQAVHFLWPPFMFASCYRRSETEVTAQFEALANNLPYAGD